MQGNITYADILKVWLPENINRRIANNFHGRTLQRPNNSIQLHDWLLSALMSSTPVIDEIINIIAAITSCEPPRGVPYFRHTN